MFAPPVSTSNNYDGSGTPTKLVSQTDERILAARIISKALPRYRRFTNYYDGNHRMAFASEKFRNTFGRLFYTFADNLCPAVVDAFTDRLNVIDFATEKGPQGLGKQAWDLWQSEKMERKAHEVHKEALKCGDAYVMVWPDPDDGTPCFYPQTASEVTVFYDDEVPGKILWAAKAWQNVDGFVRMNLYYPDYTEKWISVAKKSSIPVKPGDWKPFQAPEDVEWPIPNPYGRVPIFHFANGALPGRFGLSELKSVIPLQDALNKSVIDMLVAMEFVSFPQRYAVGMDTEIDEDTGLPKIPFQPAVDRLWHTASEKVVFGQFPAADLKQLLDVQDNLRSEIARVSGIPLHYMMLTKEHPPTGESLKALEERLVSKVQKRQVAFGDVWEAAILFGLLIAKQQIVKSYQLGSKWTDPKPKSLLEEAQTAQLKGTIGVTRRQLLTEMGYTETEIEQMEQDRAKEQQEKLDQQESQLKLEAQIQPAGTTSPAVSPTADGQRLDAKGNPTTRKEVKKQGK